MPLSFETVSRARFVSLCVIVMLAPGTAAPLESVTAPVMPPYNTWPPAGAAVLAINATSTPRRATADARRLWRLLTPHLLDVWSVTAQTEGSRPGRTSAGTDHALVHGDME